jgi:hypothetical protein
LKRHGDNSNYQPQKHKRDGGRGKFNNHHKRNSRVPEHHQQSNNNNKSSNNNINNFHNNNNNSNNHNDKQSKFSGIKDFSSSTPKLSSEALSSSSLSSHAVQNSSLSHHLHGSTQSPLKCKYCNKLFAKFTLLRKHEMLHKVRNPELDREKITHRRFSSASSNQVHQPQLSSSSSALTLTPSLLSNLNKLANLNSTESLDGKKPAILININTNDSLSAMANAQASAKIDAATKSQEMPLNSNSGLMISSVKTVDKNYYDALESQKSAATAAALVPQSNATVYIQNGKKAVSLSDLQCPICKKIVSQPFSLKVHIRTHTHEK